MAEVRLRQVERKEAAHVAQSDGQTGSDETLSALAHELLELGVPDALMLRRVLHVRSLLREADRELATLEKYFTPPATEPPLDQSPPS